MINKIFKKNKISETNLYDTLDKMSEKTEKKEIQKTHTAIKLNNLLTKLKSYALIGGTILAVIIGACLVAKGGAEQVVSNVYNYFDNFDTPATKQASIERKINQEIRKSSTDKFKNPDTGKTIYQPRLENLKIEKNNNRYKAHFTYDNKKYSLNEKDDFADGVYTITEITPFGVGIKRLDGYEFWISAKKSF